MDKRQLKKVSIYLHSMRCGFAANKRPPVSKKNKAFYQDLLSQTVFFCIDVMLIMTSDIDYAEPLKRVLFSSNKKEEINRTEGVTPTQKCFDVKAYLRVSMATKAGIHMKLKTVKQY